MFFVAGLLLIALTQPAAPAANRQGKQGEIEVQATGCVSGDTLTETNLNRGSSSDGLNPTRRWRLRLTKEQRAELKKLQGQQVEIVGVARESELAASRVVKTIPAPRGRVYVGTESSRTPSREQAVPPTLNVGSFKATHERCR